MLPSPSDMTPYKVDPFRSALMKLNEKPGRLLRVLKKEKIGVVGLKLNIFVCISIVVRISFVVYPSERLWLILNENCIKSVNSSRFSSLEQSSITCEFFSDLTLDLDQEGRTTLGEKAFNFRITGNSFLYVLSSCKQPEFENEELIVWYTRTCNQLQNHRYLFINLSIRNFP